MKKLIALIISASLFLQIVAPGMGMVTYAQADKSLYDYKWEDSSRLDDELQLKKAREQSTEALVSWKVGENLNKYELEYFIEDERNSQKVLEKVRFTFKREMANKKEAKVTLEVLELDGTRKKKDYYEYDFGNISPDGQIKHEKKILELDITDGTTTPGGRITVDNMEIRFRWKDGNVHFQTNHIKHGNITPFTLMYAGNNTNSETIKVLTGLGGYSVSPVHIVIDNDIIGNQEKIIIPNEEKKEPGSKPGIRLSFNRPKEWKGAAFETLGEEDAKNIATTLVLEDFTDKATAQLKFDLGDGSLIEGLTNKKLMYNQGTESYSLYLAADDENNENIVKWEDLKESMILKTIRLTLIKKKTDDEKAEALGSFTPDVEDGGRHTYLGYTINRTSMEEAAISIQPYNGAKNTNFKYFVEYADGEEDGVAKWVDLVEHTYVTTGEDRENPFTISVPFSSNFDDQYYKITARYGDVVMESQILHYEPKKDPSVQPPTPIIRSIDNIYAVPPVNLGDQPETIGFDLTWSAPKNTSKNNLLDQLLENGSIYYELFFHEDLESIEEKGVLTKVFKVDLVEDEDGNKEIRVETHIGTAGKETPQIGYNPSRETFTMENIVIKNPEQKNWEQIKTEEYDAYEKGNAYPDFEETDDMPSKKVPGIYYFTMRALYESETKDTPMGESSVSNPKSITISPLKEVIPVPTKIESNHSPVDGDPSKIRETLSWENIDLDRYIKQMLDPLGISIGGEGAYEVYIYQNKEIKESQLDTMTTASAIVLDTTQSYTLDKKDLEVLREGGEDGKGRAVRLDYPRRGRSGMNQILLDGLDGNQVYYVAVRVRLDLKDKAGEVIKERSSVFSKKHSFTSYTKPSDPGPGERVPPVPEELKIIDQPNNTTVTIGWKAPEYTQQEDEEVVYYEMVRTDSKMSPKQEDSRLLSIKKLMETSEENDMHAWRTKGPFVDKYAKSSDSWSEATPKQASDKLQLEDDKLSPNQLYYYYVRTALIVKGEEVYSSWVGVPVTTDPVQRPIMLKVENKDNYPHDPKREIVVSFLAPIPKGSSIPSEYDFDIAVQGELDDNYRTDYSTTRLTSKEKDEDVPVGYSHFVYRIQNAKPGKRYDIKVRITDKVVGMVNGDYPKSLYSDRVTTRTHFDQDEQDKDDKFEAYLKYFEDKVEALRRKPYWTLEDGTKMFSVKYRSNYLVPEINSTKSYNLAIKEGATNFTYYMPASVIASANLSQTSFEIKQGNVTYSVRPSTITTELEELKVALEDIKEKYIKDYYVSFNFSQRSYRVNSTIDGILTPEIMVDIELVTLKEEDLFLEDDMMVALNSEINKEKSYYIKELERALEKGKILDEDLDRIVSRSIDDIEKNHQKDVRRILERNTKKTTSIDKWNKSMLIMVAIEGNAVAQGYKLAWQETPLTTFNVGLGYGIEITEPGTYVFKGQKIIMPVIPGVGGASDLIAKYQLTDFFGINGTINPSNVAIKKDVLGAMARVLGAPRGADYVQYLKQAGIKGISNIGINLPMQKGEGTYLLMQVYEKTLKKPISSVYVKNRNIVSNIGQFNRIHQPYVLVAVDSKIMGQGSGLRPSDYMQIKDALQILTNIMAEIR